MFRKFFDWMRIVLAILGPVVLLVGTMFTTSSPWWLFLYIPVTVAFIIGYIVYNINNVADPDILFPLSGVVFPIFSPELVVNSLMEVVPSQWLLIGMAYGPLVVGIQLLEDMTRKETVIEKICNIFVAFICLASSIIVMFNGC